VLLDVVNARTAFLPQNVLTVVFRASGAPQMVSPTEAKAMAARPTPVSLAGAFETRTRAARRVFFLAHSALAPPLTSTLTRAADAMAFYGPVPELVNCRLAMVGFMAAGWQELAGSGQVVEAQAVAALPVAASLAVLVAVASLIPACAGLTGKRSGPGPFTPAAELLNGRLAAAAFATQLVLEHVFGQTLY
jgi:hypothetical protein